MRKSRNEAAMCISRTDLRASPTAPACSATWGGSWNGSSPSRSSHDPHDPLSPLITIIHR